MGVILHHPVRLRRPPLHRRGIVNDFGSTAPLCGGEFLTAPVQLRRLSQEKDYFVSCKEKSHPATTNNPSSSKEESHPATTNNPSSSKENSHPATTNNSPLWRGGRRSRTGWYGCGIHVKTTPPEEPNRLLGSAHCLHRPDPNPVHGLRVGCPWRSVGAGRSGVRRAREAPAV